MAGWGGTAGKGPRTEWKPPGDGSLEMEAPTLTSCGHEAPRNPTVQPPGKRPLYWCGECRQYRHLRPRRKSK